jgi:hypothetical protein
MFHSENTTSYISSCILLKKKTLAMKLKMFFAHEYETAFAVKATVRSLVFSASRE